MSEGAIWLHRKLLDSGVWTCSDATLRGFITCVLLANFKDQQWFSRAEHKQIVIARGSFFTTNDIFSARSKLSIQQTKNCFKTLEDLNIITRRSTRRGTFITILNYDTYQKVPTNRPTNRATQLQPNVNLKPTWLEECKEREERKEGESLSASLSISEYVNGWKRREKWDREEHAGEIAQGLKQFKLGYRQEDDLYTKIMGEDENGTIRSKSISEQAAERFRKMGLTKDGREPTAGEIFTGIRNLPKV